MTLSRQRLEAIEATAQPITFDPVLVKLRAVARDPRCQVPVLTAMIEEDPMATFAVLGRAAFGENPETVDPRPSAALAKLGTAGFTSLLEEFEAPESALRTTLSRVWEASVATADMVYALLHAVRPEILGDRADPEVAGTAGLLCEVGTVLCLRHFQGPYQKAMRILMAGDGPFADLVQRELGVTPHRLGSHWARRWGLPSVYCETLRFQNHPLAAPTEAPLACLVHVARALARAWGCTAGGDGFLEPLAPEVLELLGLRGTDLLRAIKTFAAARGTIDWFEGSQGRRAAMAGR